MSERKWPDNVIPFPKGGRKGLQQSENSGVTEQPAKPMAANFQVFAQHIQLDNVAGAGETLALLFSVDPKTAFSLAMHFHTQFQGDPTVMMRTMEMRFKIKDGKDAEAVALLEECFGTKGEQSQQIMDHLKKFVAAS